MGEIKDRYDVRALFSRPKYFMGKQPKTLVTDGLRLTLLGACLRGHEGLEGKTPSEACGIKVEGKNKWLTPIQNASRKN